MTVLVAFGIGLPLALIAAERGPRVERTLSRTTEIFLALPLVIILYLNSRDVKRSFGLMEPPSNPNM